jgi:hypothetical protein
MSKGRKDARLTLRLRKDQKRQLERAAAIESARRPHNVDAGPLLVELAWPGVERILAEAEQPQPVGSL